MHPSKLPILIEQVLYHAEFWYLIAASYTRRVDLILLDQQIRILPADAKHFLKMLHRQTGVDLAEDRAVLAAVEEDAALDGVLTIHHIVPAVAEADLRLVNDVLVEVPCNQLHPLALYAPLVDLAG